MVQEVRGLGLPLAIALRNGDGFDAVASAGRIASCSRQAGLNLTVGESDILRMTPPLIINDFEMDFALSTLETTSIHEGSFRSSC
jgi:4-aminobutyrate aminotransferase-like enzyme